MSSGILADAIYDATVGTESLKLNLAVGRN